MRARWGALLCIGVLLTVTTGGKPDAEAADLRTLRERAQAVADRVTALERRLSALGQRKERLALAVGHSSAEIGLLEVDLRDAERSLSAARSLIEERAIEVYKSSVTGEDIETLLSAQDLHELEVIAEVQAAAARADDSALEQFEEVAGETEAKQRDLEDKKSDLLAAQQEVALIEEEIAGSLTERRDALGELSDEIEALKEEAARAARAAQRQEERETDRSSGATPVVPTGLPAPTGDLAARLVGTGPTNGIPDMFTSTGVTFEGEASWYGPGFEGNLTANGDVYDSSLFTAASKTLPLNTYLYIEYEGRGIVVLVNDRGPYVGERILDLSRGTAAAIGMEHAGIGWVSAEILVRA
jgi:peptidoglycan hydrolase CwlO-like protein